MRNFYLINKATKKRKTPTQSERERTEENPWSKSVEAKLREGGREIFKKTRERRGQEL
jgi:hypothetical protein